MEENMNNMEQTTEPIAEPISTPASEPMADPNLELSEPPKKKSNIGLIIAGVAIAVVVAVAAFFLLSGKGEDNGGNDASASGDGDNSAIHNSFIESLGGVSETYTGSVSDESYDTTEEAATAYVEKELAGNAEVSIINTVSKGTLSEKEVESLKIPAEDSENIVSVEAIEVEYSEESLTAKEEGVTATATLNTTRKVKVYIIKYESSFKYYTPCPVTGETINKSYYDSVFNSDEYKNCTYTTSMKISGSASSASEGTVTLEMTTTQKALFSENAIYLEQTSSASMLGETNTETIYAYIVKETLLGEEQIVCYISEDNEEWFEASLTTIGFYSFEELTPFYDQYLDYTYFTKTDYGFKLDEDNAKQYITETLGDTVAVSLCDDLNMNIFAKYYVSGGVLSGMRMDMDMTFSQTLYSETVTGAFDVVAEMSVTNYGSTVVEKPFD